MVKLNTIKSGENKMQIWTCNHTLLHSLNKQLATKFLLQIWPPCNSHTLTKKHSSKILVKVLPIFPKAVSFGFLFFTHHMLISRKGWCRPKSDSNQEMSLFTLCPTIASAHKSNMGGLIDMKTWGLSCTGLLVRDKQTTLCHFLYPLSNYYLGSQVSPSSDMRGIGV